MTLASQSSLVDRGSATITALIVVGVASILIAGLQWRQEIQVRHVERDRNRIQVAWLHRAAIDFARLVLAEDQRNSQYDHLGEIWAIPLMDADVAQFLKTSDIPDEIAKVALMASLTDAQGLFNLRNLWSADFKSVDDAGVQVFSRLLTTLNLNPQLAQDAASELLNQGTLISDPAHLRSMPGYTNAVLGKLSPFVVVLPEVSKVNINTAPAEIVMSVVPGLTRSEASLLIGERKKGPFKSIVDVPITLSLIGVRSTIALDSSLIDVSSRFWLIRTDIQLGRGAYSNVALIQRSATAVFNGNVTQLVWSHQTRRLHSEP